MRILINASNLRKGGGLQVADSVCRELYKYPEHKFVVVLSAQLENCRNTIKEYDNVEVIEYNLPITVELILTGNNHFLDSLVRDKNIDAVLTVFGPSKWRPKCFHFCGFAMAHVVLDDSPFWTKISKLEKAKLRLKNLLIIRDFRRNADMIWTENEYISKLVRQKISGKTVITITNNCNQIFDFPEKWNRSIRLPEFEGMTFLTVTANYPHKNLRIAIDALEVLTEVSPDKHVRFVFTVTPDEFGYIPSKYKDNFVFLGPVDISKVPHLYSQSDVMFQPSLLECFSATYVEAMRMNVPILTTDIDFAHSLCDKAAYYYSPVDANALSLAIIELYDNVKLRSSLVEYGAQRLLYFDNYETRAYKLINELLVRE